MCAVGVSGMALVAGAREEAEAPHRGDDKAPSLKAKIKIEIDKPTTVTTDDLVDAVAYALKDMVKSFGIYIDDSETCETDSNVYFSTIGAQWKAVDFCLGSVGKRHLHVSARVGNTILRVAIEAEAKFEEVSG